MDAEALNTSVGIFSISTPSGSYQGHVRKTKSSRDWVCGGPFQSGGWVGGPRGVGGGVRGGAGADLDVLAPQAIIF